MQATDQGVPTDSQQSKTLSKLPRTRLTGSTDGDAEEGQIQGDLDEGQSKESLDFSTRDTGN